MTYIYDLEEQAREDFKRLHENGSGTTYDPAGYEVQTTNEYYAKVLNVKGATFGRWLDQYREERDAWYDANPFDEERYESDPNYESEYEDREIAFLDDLFNRCVAGLVEDFREQVKKRRLATKRARKLAQR